MYLFAQVEEEDELPTMVCGNCLEELNKFYKFKKLCVASDVKLRQYLLTMPPKQKRTNNNSVSI